MVHNLNRMSEIITNYRFLLTNYLTLSVHTVAEADSDFKIS